MRVAIVLIAVAAQVAAWLQLNPTPYTPKVPSKLPHLVFGLALQPTDVPHVGDVVGNNGGENGPKPRKASEKFPPPLTQPYPSLTRLEKKFRNAVLSRGRSHLLKGAKPDPEQGLVEHETMVIEH